MRYPPFVLMSSLIKQSLLTDAWLLKTAAILSCHSSSRFVFLSSYTWFVPIKWMKTGVEQQQYWLLHKTGTVIVLLYKTYILQKFPLNILQPWLPFILFYKTLTVRWECQGRIGCWRTPMYLDISGWTMMLTTGNVCSPCSTPTIRWVACLFTCPTFFILCSDRFVCPCLNRFTIHSRCPPFCSAHVWFQRDTVAV